MDVSFEFEILHGILRNNQKGSGIPSLPRNMPFFAEKGVF
jgi:hypothetical protein